MDKNIKRRTALKTIGAGALVLGSISGTALAHKDALPRDLAAVRSATARYNDPANAYADGYMAFGPDGPVPLADVTDQAEAVCRMGYHFANIGLLGTVDRTKPQVLVYGEDDDGNLVLGAVEYVIPTSALPEAEEWFHGTDDDDAWEDFPVGAPFPTSAMHAWVHTHNPDGVFAHENPRKQFSPSGCLDH